MFSTSNQSYFQYKYYDAEMKLKVYELDTSRLPANECHMIFPTYPCEELLITTAIEFFTFHPANTEMNDKFKVKIIKEENVTLFLYSIPIELMDVCKRAGKVFGMTMETKRQVLVTNEIAVELPKKSNLFSFQGERRYDPDQIDQECENIKWLGNFVEKTSLD